MKGSDRQTVTKIDRLIAMCVDRAVTLQAASDVVEDAELVFHLRTRAEAWARLGEELQSAVRESGREPRTTGSVVGTLDRAWIYLKAAVNEPEAISLECARREVAAIDRLQEANRQGLPDRIRAIVEGFLEADASLQQYLNTGSKAS